MARNKSFLDWTLFTDRSGARELRNNSIRKALKYDVYQDKTKFKAVALTDMEPMSQQGSDIFVGDNYEPDRVSTGELASLKNVRWTFKARILGKDSPHNFIPDPCDTTYIRTSDDMDRALSYIQMHTTFITPTDFDMDTLTELVREGDVVWVELDKNVSGYDLQMGRFVSKIKAEHVSVGSTSPAGGGSNLGYACDNLRDIFAGRDASRVATGLEGYVESTTEPQVTARRGSPPPPSSLIPTVVGTESVVYGSPALEDSTQMLPTTQLEALGIIAYEPSRMDFYRRQYSEKYWNFVINWVGISQDSITAEIYEKYKIFRENAPAIEGPTEYTTTGITEETSDYEGPHTQQGGAATLSWAYQKPYPISKCPNRGLRAPHNWIADINRSPLKEEQVVRSQAPLDPVAVKAAVENVAAMFDIPPPYEGEGTWEGNSKNPPPAHIDSAIATLWSATSMPRWHTPNKCRWYRDKEQGLSAQYCWGQPWGAAWSAAYISYILSNLDPDFPAAASHNKYATAGLIARGIAPSVYKSEGGWPTTVSWKTYSLVQETVHINVGDVLVEDKHYKGSGWGATHGDVVWKITGSPGEEMLWLAGGNLGGTNKTALQIAAPGRLLGVRGAKPRTLSYNRCGNYKVVLKKMFNRLYFDLDVPPNMRPMGPEEG